ncbi:MAG: hypothetical protein ACO1OK_06545 [Devosia sp.]
MLAGGTAATRVEIVHGQGQTEILFHRRGWLGRVVRLMLAAAGWLLGLLFAALMLSVGDQPSLFYLGWLAIWLVGGGVLVFALIAGAFTRETLVVRAEAIALCHSLFWWSRSDDIPAAAVTGIEWIADDPTRRVRYNGRRIPQTALLIAAGGRSRLCARGLSEAEALTVIGTIRQRLVGLGRPAQ